MNVIQNREWFLKRFYITDEKPVYGMMHPPGFQYRGEDAKYTHKHQQLTLEHINNAFEQKIRYLDQRKGSKRLPPSLYSYAIIPLHRQQEWATFSLLDIDNGGIPAVQKALSLCKKYDLWAFVQISESAFHSGGHLWIPVEKKMPAYVLKSLAKRIRETLQLKADPYPVNRLIRLPFMAHLRPPKGNVKQYPIYTTNGEILETTNPDSALNQLRINWTENDPEQITKVIQALTPASIQKPSPAPSLSQKSKTHRSKINPHNQESIIRYYLEHDSLLHELRARGVSVNGKGIYHCPWHDDKTPSLYVYFHEGKGQWVCNCLSRHSNCQAQFEDKRGHYDVFNLYCDDHGLTPSEAVKQIVEEEGIGPKTRRPTPEPKWTDTRTQEQHQHELKQSRFELETLIEKAAYNKGTLTLIQGTPGIGKGYQGSQVVNRVHQQGLNVSIVAHTKNTALQWFEELEHGFLWQAKAELCTCHEPQYLQRLGELGYTPPDCKEDCPYLQQHQESKGKVVIYQHNHLWLQEGNLILEGKTQEDSLIDLVIIDENPQAYLLQESTVTQTDLKNLSQRIPFNDPARPLLQALCQTATTCRKTTQEVNLLDELKKHLKENLTQTIQKAKKSPFAQVQLKISKKQKVEELPPWFFGKMLQALEHDTNKERSDLLHFSQNDSGTWCWSWYKKHIPLSGVGPLLRPAVVVLDGSARQELYQRLFPNWKLELHQIQVPFSPLVRLIQYKYVPNTRRMTRNKDELKRLLSKIAYELNDLKLLCSGGISYKACIPELENTLGGKWLHYQGQRGLNHLKGSECTVILGAPTLPPKSIERQAKALFCEDEDPMNTTWNKTNIPGYYKAKDPRLQLLNEINTLEELFQSLHRSRPLLAVQPQTILLFSTWDLTPLGIIPNETRAALHGNAPALHKALRSYHRGVMLKGGERRRGGPKPHSENGAIFTTGMSKKKKNSVPLSPGHLSISSKEAPLLEPLSRDSPSLSLIPVVKSGSKSEFEDLSTCNPYNYYHSESNVQSPEPLSRDSPSLSLIPVVKSGSKSEFEDLSTCNPYNYYHSESNVQSPSSEEEMEECLGCGCYFQSEGTFQTCYECRGLYGEEACEENLQAKK